ncbi:MAG: Ig-like domain-containing protein [Magnetovibrio sp.]|nr:Ig-like domain-containing protein [Magnetovibrio sp.]
MQKSVMIGTLVAVIVAVAVGLSLMLGSPETPPPPAPKPAVQEQQTSKPEAIQLTPPTFDVVRVNPEGNAVMAGRAHPTSHVEILDGEATFGTVTTDGNGEWVFVPEKLLEPGERRLGLRMTFEDHKPVLSEHVVILVVPERDGNSDGALALKVRRDGTGASEVLQKPGPEDIFGVDSVDYGNGNLTISGHAKPSHGVQLYIDNHFIGRATSDEAGRWSVTPQTDIAPGTYTLRADMVDKQNKVLARRELPFQRAEPEDTKNLEPGNFVVVQPGNSLWRLAERTYGKGLRYHMIYEANQDLIRNPDLIYPGQIFRLPGQ